MHLHTGESKKEDIFIRLIDSSNKMVRRCALQFMHVQCTVRQLTCFFPQPIAYEGTSKSPDLQRVLLTHVLICRYCLLHLHARTYAHMCIHTLTIIHYTRITCSILINPPQFIFEEYGGVTSLADQLDIHWYLHIVLVLGNCGQLKVLANKAVAD